MNFTYSSLKEILHKADSFKPTLKKEPMDKVPCKIVTVVDLNESQLLSIFHMNGYPEEVLKTTRCAILDEENAIIIDPPFVGKVNKIDKSKPVPIKVHEGLFNDGGYLIQQRLKKGIALISYNL